MIIGEAVVRIRALEPVVFDEIPNSRAIISFRNLLAHGYDVADPEAIFELSHESLADLKSVVVALLLAG